MLFSSLSIYIALITISADNSSGIFLLSEFNYFGLQYLHMKIWISLNKKSSVPLVYGAKLFYYLIINCLYVQGIFRSGDYLLLTLPFDLEILPICGLSLIIPAFAGTVEALSFVLAIEFKSSPFLTSFKRNE